MKIRTTIITLLVLIFPTLLVAQSLSNAERRAMNTSLLILIEEFEKHSPLYDESSRYAFRTLFSEDNPTIYSDMMDYSYGQNIGLEEYMASLSKRRNVSIEIKNVEHGDYIFRDGKWHVGVTFDKEIFYNDAYGTLFSSDEYFTEDYAMRMACSYNPESEQFVIEQISGSMKSPYEPLEKGFWVIKRDELADRIFANNPLRYNSFNQALMNPCSVEPWNDDVIISIDTLTSTMAYNIVEFGYTTTPWRVKPRMAFGLGQIYKLEGKIKESDSKNVPFKGSAFEFGVDGGYTFYYNNALHLSAFTGLGLSMSSLKMDTGDLIIPINYTINSLDSHAQPYKRYYNITRLSEEISYTDLSMPLYLNLDYRINRNLLLSAELGVKLLFNLSTKGSPLHLEGNVWALYDDGQTCEESAEEALGSLNGDYDSFLYPSSYARNFCDVSFVGGLSGRYNIYRNRAFAFLKVSYELGLNKIHTDSESSLINISTSKYPVIYSARHNSNIARASFMKAVDYSRRILWLELGVNYKF